MIVISAKRSFATGTTGFAHHGNPPAALRCGPSPVKAQSIFIKAFPQLEPTPLVLPEDGRVHHFKHSVNIVGSNLI